MILRHSTLNVIGLGAPILAALVVIPILLGHLGQERFGALTLVWAVVNYFGLADFGLGRALTRQISMSDAEGKNDRASSVIWTALLLLFCTGMAAAVAIWLAAPLAARHIADPGLLEEIQRAFRVLALGIPAVVLVSGLRGALEARLAFGPVNAFRVLFGVYAFVAPLAVVLLWTSDLAALAAALVAGRVLILALHWAYAARLYPGFGRPVFSSDFVGDLIRTGGWLTIASLIGPLIGYLDRFFIGFMAGAADAARYAVPQEMAMRLSVAAVALSFAIFPRFAAITSNLDPSGRRLEQLSHQFIFVTALPLCSGVWFFAPEILALWIGPELGGVDSILQILAAMMLISSFAIVPWTRLQATGGARIVAVLLVAELPIYALALWLIVPLAGLEGVAAAALVRSCVDAAALQVALDVRQRRRPLGDFSRAKTVLLTAFLVALFAASFLDSLAIRIALFAAALIAAGIMAYCTLGGWSGTRRGLSGLSFRRK